MNLNKLFQKKDKDTSEDRRSGEDRREQVVSDSGAEDTRENKERREVLQGYNKIIDSYGKIPLFKGLANEQLLKMLRICSKIKSPGNQYLFHQGEEAKTMFILLKGRLNIMLEGGEVWKSVTPFGCVGEMGFFSETTRSANVITVTECVLLQINKAEISKLFLKDKDLHIIILRNIVNELTNRLLSDHEEIEQLHYRIRASDSI